MKNIKFDRFFFLGLFVLVSVFANQYVNFVRWHNPAEILWFCDMTAVILGIGLIFRNRIMITLALVMAIPAQFRWILDFFLEAVGMGAGRTATLFSYGLSVFWLSVNLHAIVIPISLYGVWQLGFAKNALPAILGYGFVLLTTTYLFTNPQENINCVFYACDADYFQGQYFDYFLIKVLLFWEFVFLTSFFACKGVADFFAKNKNKKSNEQEQQKEKEMINFEKQKSE
jgi:hypothetical protein